MQYFGRHSLECFGQSKEFKGRLTLDVFKQLAQKVTAATPGIVRAILGIQRNQDVRSGWDFLQPADEIGSAFSSRGMHVLKSNRVGYAAIPEEHRQVAAFVWLIQPPAAVPVKVDATFSEDTL